MCHITAARVKASSKASSAVAQTQTTAPAAKLPNKPAAKNPSRPRTASRESENDKSFTDKPPKSHKQHEPATQPAEQVRNHRAQKTTNLKSPAPEPVPESPSKGYSAKSARESRKKPSPARHNGPTKGAESDAEAETNQATTHEAPPKQAAGVPAAKQDKSLEGAALLAACGCGNAIGPMCNCALVHLRLKLPR